MYAKSLTSLGWSGLGLVIKPISLTTFDGLSGRKNKHLLGLPMGYISRDIYIPAKSAQRKHKSSETVVKHRKCLAISSIKRDFYREGSLIFGGLGKPRI